MFLAKWMPALDQVTVRHLVKCPSGPKVLKSDQCVKVYFHFTVGGPKATPVGHVRRGIAFYALY